MKYGSPMKDGSTILSSRLLEAGLSKLLRSAIKTCIRYQRLGKEEESLRSVTVRHGMLGVSSVFILFGVDDDGAIM